MEKILIIHPTDETTDFLSEIYRYSDLSYSLITDTNISDKQLITEIKNHDTIIMLGHGTPNGLLCNYHNKQFSRLLINSEHVYLLREKKLIGVWCYANEFFLKHDLKGFCTNMFISEMSEALDLQIKCTDMDINLNNKLLANTLQHNMFTKNSEELCSILFERFKEHSKNNNVVRYNSFSFNYLD